MLLEARAMDKAGSPEKEYTLSSEITPITEGNACDDSGWMRANIHEKP
jgi:hypothetical protein